MEYECCQDCGSTAYIMEYAAGILCEKCVLWYGEAELYNYVDDESAPEESLSDHDEECRSIRLED